MALEKSGGKTGRFFAVAATVKTGDLWTIELDGRGVRTPGGSPLAMPHERLCDAIAAEWTAQGDNIVPQTMPLCGLANAAIDRIAPEPEVFVDQLSKFAKSDLVCYWADEPADLVECQRAVWQPLLNWAVKELDAPLTRTSGINHVSQPPEAIQAITGRVARLNHMELAAVTDLATSLSSVVIALAVLHGEISAESAFQAAMVDEHYQAEKWGEDIEALERQRQIKADVSSTAIFLTLISSAG